MKEQDKRQILNDTWKHPEKYKPTQTELKVIEDLELFIDKIYAYNGKIICGEHGVGKTFTLRYFLSKKGLLDEKHYVDVNKWTLGQVADVLGSGIRSRIRQIAKRLIEYLVTAESILVLDCCEVLKFLNNQDFQTLVDRVHYSSTKIILVLPTELDPRRPSITTPLKTPTMEDHSIFLRNLRVVKEIPTKPAPFTTIIKKVLR